MAKNKHKEKRKNTLPPTECKGCGAGFIPVDYRQKFHSPACREAFYEKVYFSGVKATKTCPNCGDAFTTSKPVRQIYCKPECRQDAFEKRKDGIVASLSAEQEASLRSRFVILRSSSFRCGYCGKGVQDGITLDVEEDAKGEPHTVCNQCARGKKLSEASL